MSKKDAVTKDYMGNSAIFADAFNFLIYDGQPVINSKQLRAMDTAELVLPYGKDGARTSVQRYRDELKYLTAMEDGNAAYMVLGIETQSEPHYAMPVRDMLYDAMQYARQVKEAASSHREEAKKQRSMAGPGEIGEKKSSESRESLDSGEFLGGFYRNDRLLPVITLVILFSPDPWDGPMSIYEMLADVDERFLPFVQDYRINLITPAALDEESINRFRTSLREVMLYIKYSRDKDQLRNILETHPRFLERV